ncbi:MAG: hypothetical protein H7Y04_02185 [Verrucomicrobia bacterium]|nr:hypothetical protein [Cytophagales bacterium]
MLVILLWSSSAFAQKPHKILVKEDYKLYPDETLYQDTSLVNFLYRLQKAVDERDAKYFFSILDKGIHFKFDKQLVGIGNFGKEWNKGNDALVWNITARLLEMGGTYTIYDSTNKQFKGVVLPYVFAAEMPNKNIHRKQVLAVTGESVLIREKPDANAKVTGVLAYDVVLKTSPQNAEASEWILIETVDEKLRGYVNFRYLYSPLDYRIFINKINGKWKIMTITKG